VSASVFYSTRLIAFDKTKFVSEWLTVIPITRKIINPYLARLSRGSSARIKVYANYQPAVAIAYFSWDKHTRYVRMHILRLRPIMAKINYRQPIFFCPKPSGYPLAPIVIKFSIFIVFLIKNLNSKKTYKKKFFSKLKEQHKDTFSENDNDFLR
jgi:hypothetical protein